MTNQDESKNRNHINTGASFNFFHYRANLLQWGGPNWVTFASFFKESFFQGEYYK